MFNLWDPELIKGKGHGIVQTPKNGKELPIRVGHGMFSSSDTYFVTKRQAFDIFESDLDEPLFEIKLVNDIIFLRSLDGKNYELEINGGKKTIVSEKPQRFKLFTEKPSPLLHLASKDVKHRVISFSMKLGS